MLDKKQAAHVQANRARIRQGRLRTVTLILKNGAGTTYAAAQCTWKEEQGARAGAANRSEGGGNRSAVVVAEFAPDVDLATVVAIADTPNRAQVAGARTYRVQEQRKLGLTAAPNRIVVTLREER